MSHSDNLRGTRENYERDNEDGVRYEWTEVVNDMDVSHNVYN